MDKGTLYVVATPIGNLQDITFRAVETLKTVAFILAENPRESIKILNKYDIHTQIISYRDQNHDRMIGKIVEKLNVGLSMALISDAGTPVISDPGFRLISQLKEQGFNVIPIPGASSVSSALSASGLPSDKYLFIGFLPKSDIKIEKELLKYKELDATVILFESPARLIQLLENIQKYLGNRIVSVAKDISKLKEEIKTDKIENLVEFYKNKETIKGEYVVSIAKEDYQI